MEVQKIQKSTADPVEIYQAKLTQLQAEYSESESASSRLATARAVVFLFAVAIIWFSLIKMSIAFEWLLIPVAMFALLVWQHSRADKRLAKVQQAQRFYSHRMDHIVGNWQGQGQTGTRYIDASHPYTSDLDIFGSDSLYEFLCCARTRLGEDTLAQWLSRRADAQTVALRQDAVRELSNHLEFREALALLDAVSDNGVGKIDIQHWIQEDYPIKQWQRVLATILGVLAVVALLIWALGYGRWPLLLVILLEIPLYVSCYRPIKKMAQQAQRISSTLADLKQVLGVIEPNKFDSILLKQLTDPLQATESIPSVQIGKMYNLLERLNQCVRNQLLMPFALLFGIPVHLAFRLEHWRKHVGQNIELWLDAVGQIEALSSLATHGFEHPGNTYPSMLSESPSPVFSALALSHPLIPATERVANDISLNDDQQLVMVSGSNMSGKSTLLRSIGIGAVMASSGAPVQAQHLELSSFNIGCAMRANDSLQDGSSLFYAVITRLKSVVDLAKAGPPLLFLLDEILQGTNSHDRLVGAKGVIHQLMEYSAIGLVTTHDLALTRIVDSLGSNAINIHFEDQFIDGKISFDYKIRPGVTRKSNGLALMRMIGLDVDTDS